MKKVLVTDGEQRSSLAVTRSLGKQGYQIVVTGNRKKNLSSCSKFCNRCFEVPNPLNDGRGYITAIANIAKTESIDVIVPMTDQSIGLLNVDRKILPRNTILACPPANIVDTLSNKIKLLQLAQKLRVPIPKTIFIENLKDLKSCIDDIISYPVVIKPSLSRIPDGNRYILGGVMYASSKRELKNLYSTREALQCPSMIQEKIVGPGTGLFTLFDVDRHLALFSHRRLREKPPSGGVSVVSESVPLDPEIVEASKRLLSAIQWTGVAMVEFKRDKQDGKAKLMEINGRFWGTLQLAISCGVDFPRLLLDYLQGEKPDKTINEYDIGIKMKWLLGTLDHLIIRLRNRDENLNLPPNTPTKWQALIDFLRVNGKDIGFDVYDPKDIRTFMCELALYFRQVLKLKR